MTQTPIADPGPLPLLYDQDTLRDFLKEGEGTELNKEGLHTPYLDKGQVPTIGYGSTYYPDGTAVTMNDAPIDDATAAGYLDNYTSETEGILREIPAIQRLNPNQQAAIMSFAYNLGNNFYGDMNRFGRITRALNSGNPDRIIQELAIYNKVEHPPNSGKFIVSEGLNNRRQAEIELFKTPYIPPDRDELRENAVSGGSDRYEY